MENFALPDHANQGNFRKLSTNRPRRWRAAQCRRNLFEPSRIQPRLAVLFIDVCRYVGIAARFVNGYYHDGGAKERLSLHSWGEVYLPGVGWRGYDPSQGLAVTDCHVVIAAAGDPLLSAPVSGTFRGNAITSELHAEIEIMVAGADAA